MALSFSPDRFTDSAVPVFKGHQEMETPELLDTMAAAFRTHNSVSSAVARGFRGYMDDPDYDPLDPAEIAGYEPFAMGAVSVGSREEMVAWKQGIDAQLRDRETLERSGAIGILSSVFAGALDPIFIASLGITGGAPSFVRTGLAGVAGEALTEIPLQATQEVRTVAESAINISAAGLLSGVAGSAIKGLSKSRYDDVLEAIQKDMTEPLVGDSAGSAKVGDVSFEDSGLADSAGAAKALKQTTPQLRVAQSDIQAAREGMEQLAESALFVKKHGKGIAAPDAVETRIKSWDGPYAVAVEEMDKLFLKYRSRQAKTGAILAVGVKDLFSKSAKMKHGQFRSQIGRAMRRNDEHEIPEVAAAAKVYREKIFEPMKKRAIEEGLLHADVSVATAASYLTRLYKIEKIIQNRGAAGGFDEILENWLRRQTHPDGSQLLDDTQISQAVSEIIDNITSTPVGLMHANVMPKAGPLKDRVLDIDDRLIEKYLEDDIQFIAGHYVRSMAPEIELAAKFGDKEMTSVMQRIDDEADILITKSESKSAKSRINIDRKNAKRDIAAVRDLLLGTYGQPRDPMSPWVRGFKGMRNYSYIRSLGGMTISAFPDIPRLIARQGFSGFSGGLRALGRAADLNKVGREVLKEWGIGLDMVTNSRARAIADIDLYTPMATSLERGLSSAASTFGVVSLMAPWNASMKQFAGLMTSNTLLKWSRQAQVGRLSKKNIRKMAQMGINPDMAGRIADQVGKKSVRDGIWLANVVEWKDKQAADVLRMAILKEVDTIIVTPGVAEKMLINHTEIGKTVLQFKSFAFAANTRIMISGLQQRDAQVLSGALLSIAMGELVYVTKSAYSGYDISDNKFTHLKEAIDRSGLFGIGGDVYNMANMASRGAINVGEPLSRYRSRGQVGNLAGPTFGLIDDGLRMVGAASDLELKGADKRAARRLLPYQSLFYLRALGQAVSDED